MNAELFYPLFSRVPFLPNHSAHYYYDVRAEKRIDDLIWIFLRCGVSFCLFCLLCSLCLGRCLCSPFCPFVCLLPSKLLSQNQKIHIQNNNKNDRCQNRVHSFFYARNSGGNTQLTLVSAIPNPLPSSLFYPHSTPPNCAIKHKCLCMNTW